VTSPGVLRLRARLEALRAARLDRVPLPQERLEGAGVLAGGRRAVQFCSNDVLGLSRHPAVLDAARGALDQGAGATGSRLLSGDLPGHRALEAAASAAFGRPALLWSSGTHANTGLVPALAGRGNLVFSDADVHASLVDGCRLCRGRTVIWPHNDVEALGRLVEEHRARREEEPEGADLLIAESVYSMDGSLAPLERLVEIAEAAGLLLVLDEAHGFGVRGPRGLGLADERGLLDRVPVIMAGLGKAAGAMGALTVATAEILDLLRATARPWIFSTALPPAVTAAATAALEILGGAEGAALRGLLAAKARRLRRGLGLPTEGPEGASHIVPVPVGDEERSVTVAARLLDEHGILCRAVRHPTVPRGASRLRLSVMAQHDPEELDRAAAAIRRLLEET